MGWEPSKWGRELPNRLSPLCQPGPNPSWVLAAPCWAPPPRARMPGVPCPRCQDFTGGGNCPPAWLLRASYSSATTPRAWHHNGSQPRGGFFPPAQGESGWGGHPNCPSSLTLGRTAGCPPPPTLPQFPQLRAETDPKVPAPPLTQPGVPQGLGYPPCAPLLPPQGCKAAHLGAGGPPGRCGCRRLLARLNFGREPWVAPAAPRRPPAPRPAPPHAASCCGCAPGAPGP